MTMHFSISRFLIVLLLTLSPLAQAADQAESRAAARAIFDEAASSHRAMRAAPLNAIATIFKTHSTVGPLDDETTATQVVKWRFDCRADYSLGITVSESYRLSEVFQGVEQIDVPRPVLAYQMCRDCEMKSLRQTISVLDPNWSDIEPRMKDDSTLVDPLDVMDRLANGPTADFLDMWSGAYLHADGLFVSVNSAADGSITEIAFEVQPNITHFVFEFERIGGELRLSSLEQTPPQGSNLDEVIRTTIRWATVIGPHGETFVLPILNEFYTLGASGPVSREYRVEDWQLLPPAENTQAFEEYIATQSALIAYDGIAHRLEVESIQREAEQAEQNAP